MEVIGDYPFLCNPFDTPVYLYESNDSVFFAMEVGGNFRLAYNFNAEVGEFWDYQLPISDVAVVFFRATVVAVDNVIIDGNEVKEMILAYQSMYTPPHVEIVLEEIMSNANSLDLSTPFLSHSAIYSGVMPKHL